MTRFIKEIGTPKRVLVTNKKDYIDFIKKWNGKTNLYETIYKFKYLKNDYSPDYNTAVVDKLFFDFDNKNALQSVILFHNYLINENIQHYLKQSSLMKFHVYICTLGSEDLNNKKDAVMNAMIYLAQEAGLTYGKGMEFDLDISTFGDLARICPIAGTYKPKRKSWCNYISETDLYNIELLKEKASKPKGSKILYGGNPLNLKKFDTKRIDIQNREFETSDFNVTFKEKHIQILPPFIQKVLMDYNEYGHWQNRWRFAVLCRDLGYPKSLTDTIAKKYFSKVINRGSLNGKGTNYDHFCKVHVLNSVYNGQEKYKFTATDLLQKEGYEITKEDIEFFSKLYY